MAEPGEGASRVGDRPPDLLTQRADGVEDARFKSGIVAVEAGVMSTQR